MADHGEFSRVRKRLQKEMELAEEERKRLLLRKRIELANQGVRAYQQHRVADAVRAFHSYIRILEDWKQVNEGSLGPSNFDVQKDISELLLISGVYWDLVKLYDRTASGSKQKEFRHYLEKYILFSKGMPFQSVSAETLRKYILAGKPVHKEEFKNAYKVIAGSNCFVVTSLMDHTGSSTLERLRVFRDESLIRRASGRAFVSWYYRNGESIAQGVDRLPEWTRYCLAKLVDLAGVAVSAGRSRSARDETRTDCR